MADIVSPEKRSLMMAGIKAKNTRPELLIRSGLHNTGFRYRLHSKNLPGKPDMVFPKYKAVIFVHGCFWHGHDCHLFKWPTSKEEFWKIKITKNQERDLSSISQLLAAGYRVGIIWECTLKGKTKRPIEELIVLTSNWLLSNVKTLEIK
jgi:DNA mismatch endonuclease (patch repair protein)